jgi:hypothetical protein
MVIGPCSANGKISGRSSCANISQSIGSVIVVGPCSAMGMLSPLGIGGTIVLGANILGSSSGVGMGLGKVFSNGLKSTSLVQ